MNVVTAANATYFNAGVLLLNLKKWRSDGISAKLKNVLLDQPERLRNMDQDALNLVLHDSYLQLELK